MNLQRSPAPKYGPSRTVHHTVLSRGGGPNDAKIFSPPAVMDSPPGLAYMIPCMHHHTTFKTDNDARLMAKRALVLRQIKMRCYKMPVELFICFTEELLSCQAHPTYLRVYFPRRYCHWPNTAPNLHPLMLKDSHREVIMPLGAIWSRRRHRLHWYINRASSNWKDIATRRTSLTINREETARSTGRREETVANTRRTSLTIIKRGDSKEKHWKERGDSSQYKENITHHHQ